MAHISSETYVWKDTFSTNQLQSLPGKVQDQTFCAWSGIALADILKKTNMGTQRGPLSVWHKLGIPHAAGVFSRPGMQNRALNKRGGHFFGSPYNEDHSICMLVLFWGS